MTVYRAQLPWAKQAVRRLREAGLDAAIVHEPNLIVQQKAGSSLYLEVALPLRQAEEARRLLEEWERDAEQRTRGVSARLVRDLIISFIPPGLLAAVAFALNGELSPWAGFLGFGLWLATVLVIGKLQRRRQTP